MADTGTMDDTNRATVTVGGVEYEVEASNAAMLVYAKEFRDKAERPYTGNLIVDAGLDISRAADLGTCVAWCDIPHVAGAIWAMARAAGSTKDTWRAFDRRLQSAPANIYEPADAEGLFVGEFGERTFFRVPAGHRDAGLADAAPEVQGASPGDRRGRGVAGPRPGAQPHGLRLLLLRGLAHEPHRH